MAVSGGEVESVATKAMQDLGYAAMKPEQLQVVAVCFADATCSQSCLLARLREESVLRCLSSVYDEPYPSNESSAVLVVTP